MKLNDAQLSSMFAALGRANAAGTSEPGAGGRVSPGARATIVFRGDRERGEIISVVVVNLCDSGVAILHGAPMRVGEQFILRIPATAREPASAILCRVANSQRSSNGPYLVTAQFDRVLQGPPARNEREGPINERADIEEQDLEHIREVESRLNQLNL